MARSSSVAPSPLLGFAVFGLFVMAAAAGCCIKAKDAGWLNLSPVLSASLGTILIVPGPSLLSVIIVWPETPAWWPTLEMVVVTGSTLLIGALLGLLVSQLQRGAIKLVWILLCAVLLYPVGWLASSYVGLLTFAGRTLVIEDPSRPEIVFVPGLLYTVTLTALMAGAAIGLRRIEARTASSLIDEAPR